MNRAVSQNFVAVVALCSSLWGCAAEPSLDSDKKSLQAAADALIADLTAEGGAAQVVGSEGGTVEDSTSGAAIAIPAGALPEAASDDAYVVSVVPLAGAALKAPAGYTLAGDQFDITIQSVRDQTSVQPLEPVRITLPYAKSVDEADTELLAVGNYHGSKWVTQATEKIDAAALRVTALFTTLSPFGALLAARGNSVPVADDQSITTQEDGVLAGTVSGSDADDDELTFALATGGDVAHGVLTLQSNGAFTYAPAANFYGSDQFMFTVSDGLATSEVGILSITVNAVNDAPTLTGLNLTTLVNAPVQGTLVGADVEGTALTYSIVTAPTHGSVAVTASTGVLVYTPQTNYKGSDVFYVRAGDGGAYSPAVAVHVNVVGVYRYVRPSAAGTGDGTSWANATNSLQTAINAVAAAGAGEVWIAKGSYRATGTGALVTLAANVDLYGGFAATEATLAERGVVDARATVLSGDTDSSGTFTSGDAYHVVRGASARLDGLTITGGNAVGAGSDGQGGGIYHGAAGKPLTLVNVRIDGNHAASDGGGIYTTANVVLRNARLENNTAGSSSAGLFVYYGNVTMENAAVVGNAVTGNGGGLYIMYSTLDFRGGTVDGNSATQSGGGIYFTGAKATVFNVQISHNSAGTWHGGGIYDSSSSELTLIHADVVGNSAVANGGGIAVFSSPSLTVRNSSFWGNTAASGKDIYNPPSPSVYSSCSETSLSAYGAANSTATTTPFSAGAAGGEYFFDPAHGCANWGNAATATTYFAATGTAWENWSSESAGLVMEGTTAGVAAGVLIHPEDVWVRAFDVTGNSLTWLTNASATTCRITNDADSSVFQLGASDLPSGAQSHSLASGTVVTLTCDSPRSYPKEATGTVP